MYKLQAWLGHSTIGTTANIYTHLDENNKLSSANAIIAILPVSYSVASWYAG